ncbi:hypothetical protein CXB51_010989 [Gossypium anomalum]|uniref:Integrase catalytic domain-containing protein n=1 Tax=Gossypium anomalum TaxID=47600 RepID=A0A8J5ZNT3_9ROSI|nr:hypothetical protein CXB51_010989 [Gossypium anomalum]
MSMNDHVNSFNKILADLLNLDEKFEDEDKALLLLNSLPDEYDHLTTTLLHWKDTITFDVVCSALYRSETRKKDKRDNRDTTTEVLTVRGRSHSRKSAEHDEESDFSLVGMAMACHMDEWILDSGCTYNMCPNKDCFSSLKELEGGVVLMGNDSAFIGSTSTVSTKGVDLEATRLWHMRLGHAGKQTRVKFGPTIHNTKGILDYVHSDVWGPTKVASLGGMHYFVTFVDDYSRKVWAYLMKRKNKVLDAFLKWKKMVETQTGRKVKRLRSDNGTEYKNYPFLQYVKMRALCDTSLFGIHHSRMGWQNA